MDNCGAGGRGDDAAACGGQERLSCGGVIIVEGKYDRVRLAAVVDARIVETGGFAIFTDDARMDMIREMARRGGAVIMTDGDGAGFMIRTYLANKLSGLDVRHAYIPDVMGKERRKAAPSKEGKLGVEGQEAAVLREALMRAGAVGEPGPRGRQVLQADLYEDGLLGRENSAALRDALKRKLGLPARLSAKRLLDVINSIMSYEQYRQAADGLK